MQPIRQIVEDMPEFFLVPPEVRHQRVEIIIWPLERQSAQGALTETVVVETAQKRRSVASLAGTADYSGPHITDEEMDAARFAAKPQ